MESRSHAPLCRTSRGQPTMVMTTSPRGTSQGGGQNLGVGGGNPTMPNDFDSCYSSCDDISHPSLSRESSDPLDGPNDGCSSSSGTSGIDHTKKLPKPEVVDFATKLGYSMDQLIFALNRIGFDAKQDQLLSELVKMGNQGANEHVMSRAAANATPTNIDPMDQLRSIVIDGSNVAMAHGRKEVFSCAGIRESIRFFAERGHRDIIVFIPQFRKEQARSDSPITDQHILFELEKYICWTPSRNVNGRRVVCHDDRYILKTAEEKDAVIVSNDEYRDLTKENPAYRRLVEQRQLMFTIVDDKFVPPDDPMGRYGPRLDAFLSKAPVQPGTQICPYARKCTYGNKCKFYHPERANGSHMSVTERLMKENQQKKSLSAVKSMQYEMFKNKHAALARTQSLNMVKATNPENMAPHQLNLDSNQRHHVPVHQVNSAPWQHQSVARISSMPLSPVNRPGMAYGSGNNHMSLSRNSSANNTLSQTHLFAPSTAVWGHSELSVGPMSTGHQQNELEADPRSRVQYHLANLFPEAVVEAVMAANPEETNAQVLCEKILKMGRGFNYK